MTKRGLLGLVTTVLAMAAAGCGPERGDGSIQENGMSSADMSTVVEDLRVVAGSRILLGHQSVGRNILAGLASLAEEAGVVLRIVEVTGAPPDDGPGIFHSNIGENGDPESKCEVFAELLTAYGEPDYDIAMMKFCYVDLGRDTPLEVTAMIDRYSRLVDEVRARRPDVQLVHISMPLRAEPPGRKTAVKRFLGLSTVEDADNVLRNAFNDALRARYSGEPLFDLAAVESTLPDGTRSAFEHDGEIVHTLANAYTEDRGHLNAPARRRAAIAFVRTLADTLRSGAKDGEGAAGS